MTTTEGAVDGVTALPPLSSPQLQHTVEQFFYAEAELLDDHRYLDWITLWTEDCRYWMPVRVTKTIRERKTEVAGPGMGSLADDDYGRLRGRVRRITSGQQWSEEPQSRTRHLLTNIRVTERGDGEIATRTNFYVYRSRLERHQDWFVGERFDVLRPAESDFPYPYKIANRKIVLEQTTVLSPSISIFL